MRRKAKLWSSTREGGLQAADNGGRQWGAIPTEEWIKRAWGKVENKERMMLVEGIDDLAAESGDRWWGGGGNEPSSGKNKRERRES